MVLIWRKSGISFDSFSQFKDIQPFLRVLIDRFSKLCKFGKRAELHVSQERVNPNLEKYLIFLKIGKIVQSNFTRSNKNLEEEGFRNHLITKGFVEQPLAS